MRIVASIRRIFGTAVVALGIGLAGATAAAAAVTWENNITGSGPSALNSPEGVAMDGSNIVVADAGNHRLEVFSPNGSVQSFSSSFSFSEPREAVLVGSNFVVSDHGSGTVEKINATTGADDGSFGTPPKGWVGNTEVATNGGHSLVAVANSLNHEVDVFTAAGTFVRALSSTPGAPQTSLSYPEGVGFDASNNVWVGDTQNHRIVEFSGTGSFVKAWGYTENSGNFYPTAVSVDPATGDLWVADWQHNQVIEFNQNGSVLAVVNTAGGTNPLEGPLTVALDPATGDLYVAAEFGNEIARYSTTTTPSRSTETNAGCPQQVAGTGVTCSVSVTDTAGGTKSSPQGTVSWSSSAGGAAGFTNNGICQLQADQGNPAVSSCDIGYASPDADTATDQIALTYSPSDAVHAGSNDAIQASVIAPPIATTQVPSFVSSNELDLQGVIINAERLDTRYYFQYGPDLQHMVQDQPAYPGTDIGSSATPSQPVPVSAVLRGLSSNTTYCYRLVAVNAAGTTYAHDAGSGDPGTNDGLCQQTSGPPIAPRVAMGAGSVLSDGSIDFFGTVNPELQPTKWFIQYSIYQDESYANGSNGRKVGGEVPLPEPGQDLGNAGISPTPVGALVSGLTPGTTYWFRIVASNGSGTTYGYPSVAVRPLTLQASHTGDPRFELSGLGAEPGQDVSIAVTPTFDNGPTHGASIHTSARADGLGHFSVSLAQGHFSGLIRGAYKAVAQQGGHADAATAFTLRGRPLNLLVSDGGNNAFTIKINGADPYAVVHISVERPGGDVVDHWKQRADRDGVVQLTVKRGPGTSFPSGRYVAKGTTRHEGGAAFPFMLVDQAVKRSNKYVALGDSYSAGVGTYTDNLDGDCHQSDDAYAPRLAAKRDWKLTFKACSGATTTDVDRQLGVLGKDTGYVTVSVGGNDVGFADVVRTCAIPGFNHDADCAKTIDVARAAAGDPLSRSLDSLFGKIANDAPNAQIVVVGYPHPFDGAGDVCFNGSYFINADEAQQLNAADDLLNSTIKAAAERHGFQFINPTSGFDGHDICAPHNWINHIDAAHQTESFHPTVGGQTEYLDLIAGVLK